MAKKPMTQEVAEYYFSKKKSFTAYDIQKVLYPEKSLKTAINIMSQFERQVNRYNVKAEYVFKLGKKVRKLTIISIKTDANTQSAFGTFNPLEGMSEAWKMALGYTVCW